MNFFQKIGAAIAGFFRAPATKRILDMGVKLLKAAGVAAAEQLQRVAREEVERAELEGGKDKYERAFKAIRGRIPGTRDIKESAINLAIETAVQALRVSGRF